MKDLTHTGKHIDELKVREVKLTLSNSSDADQTVILIDSPALPSESTQVVKPVTFGVDKTISFNDTVQGKILASLKAFSSKFPVLLRTVKVDCDSMNQLSESVKVQTPVLLDEPIAETIVPKLRIGGADYDLPANLFVGEGAEVSLILKAKTTVTVTLILGCYKANRLVS